MWKDANRFCLRSEQRRCVELADRQYGRQGPRATVHLLPEELGTCARAPLQKHVSNEESLPANQFPTCDSRARKSRATSSVLCDLNFCTTLKFQPHCVFILFSFLPKDAAERIVVSHNIAAMDEFPGRVSALFSSMLDGFEAELNEVKQSNTILLQKTEALEDSVNGLDCLKQSNTALLQRVEAQEKSTEATADQVKVVQQELEQQKSAAASAWTELAALRRENSELREGNDEILKGYK